MGKNILVLAATSIEIRPFIQAFKKDELNLSNNSLDILVGGIGLTATTYHLTKQLTLKKYDRVIQAGVAGSYDLNISLGDVVAVKQDTIADQSVVEMKKLKTLFDLKLVPHNQHPYQKDWLINPDKNILKTTGLKPVRGISVNEISSEEPGLLSTTALRNVRKHPGSGPGRIEERVEDARVAEPGDDHRCRVL